MPQSCCHCIRLCGLPLPLLFNVGEASLGRHTATKGNGLSNDPHAPTLKRRGRGGNATGRLLLRAFLLPCQAQPPPQANGRTKTQVRGLPTRNFRRALTSGQSNGPACSCVCARALARAWRRAEIDCLAAAGDLRIVRLHTPRASPVHHPYIARTSPVHPPMEIPRENVFARIRRREDTPVLSFTTREQTFLVNFHRGMYGGCTGDVRAMYGRCTGDVMYVNSLDERAKRSER